jgi:hypothetical protein
MIIGKLFGPAKDDWLSYLKKSICRHEEPKAEVRGVAEANCAGYWLAESDPKESRAAIAGIVAALSTVAPELDRPRPARVALSVGKTKCAMIEQRLDLDVIKAELREIGTAREQP